MNTESRPRRIVAEVWDRLMLGMSGTRPYSRHTTVAKAEAAAHKLNAEWATRPYLVYAKLPDVGEFVELVSWKGGIKTRQDPEWTYNGQRFATADEANRAVRDLHSRWMAVTDTVVAPSNEPVNYRWDDLTGRAAPLGAPAVPPVAQDAPQALPAVEQALRDAGVAVESPDDPTEATRRVLVAQINADPGSREALEEEHGQVWSTSELTTDYDVLSFSAPDVCVRRKSDGKKGWLRFQHSPRFYYWFREA